MGGNDLNLKKSWHPQLMTNQRRVYDAEQAALQERKITEARLEEIRRERQIEETQKQLEASGGPKRIDRVEWMYQGTNDTGRDEYSSEAFLLGKRRIDSILRGDDAKKVEQTAGPTGEAPGPMPVVASARDTAAKIREDPLVAIKRQEQEAYQAMMKDPTKRRQLLAQMGIAEEEPKKERRHREHRHRSDRHRSHRHRDSDRKHRDDSRQRSRSPRRYDDSDYEQHPRRRRSDIRDRDQERTRDRRRYDSDDEDRRRRQKRDYIDRGPNNSGQGDGRSRRGYSERRPNGNEQEEERARKLAAMQNDATDLDRAREARLAALAEKEQLAREADDRARVTSQKYGGRDFANRLHNSAGSGTLADRIGRGRQGLQRDDD